MSATIRAAQMLSRLPPAWQDGPQLRALLETLGDELGQVEQGATLLLRSRQVALSSGWSARELRAIEAEEPEEAQAARRALQSRTELGRLGALLGLRPDPDETARDFRLRMARMLSVHRQGLGSAEGLLQLVALEYRAAWPPQIALDQATGRWRATLDVPASGRRRRVIHVELEDHPERPQRQTLRDLTEGEGGLLEQPGLEPVRPELRLRATTGLRLPALEHAESRQVLLYLGELTPGQTLRLRHLRHAEIDGALASAPVVLLPDASARHAQLTDATLSRMVLGVRVPSMACGEHRLALFQAPEAWLDQLAARLGENAWTGDALRFDEPGARFTERHDAGPGAAFAGGEGAVLPAASAATRPGRADLEATWIAREPGAFAVHVPAGFVPPRFASAEDWAGTLRRTLEYGRAAGVRAWLVAELDPLSDDLPVADALSGRSALAAREATEADDALRAAAALGLPEDAGPVERQVEQICLDQSAFDATFLPMCRDDAMFGESRFGAAALHDRGEGVFGRVRFGGGRLVDAMDGVFGRSSFGDADFGARALPRFGRLVLDEVRFPEALGLGLLDAARLDLSILGRGLRGVLELSRFDEASFLAPRDGRLLAEPPGEAPGIGLDAGALASGPDAALDAAAIDLHTLAPNPETD